MAAISAKIRGDLNSKVSADRRRGLGVGNSNPASLAGASARLKTQAFCGGTAGLYRRVAPKARETTPDHAARKDGKVRSAVSP